MSDCKIGPGAKIDYAIIDSEADIAPGVKIKGNRSGDPVVIEHGAAVTEDIIEG